MRIGGPPLTDDEALGVARRIARTFAARQAPNSMRSLNAMAETETWPDPNKTTQAAWRLPVALLWRLRAKAEVEGITTTQVVRQALEAYVASPPGSRVKYTPPKQRGV